MKQNGVLFEHGVLDANKVMIDYLDDNRRRLKRVMAGIDDNCLHWMPDPGANSIAVAVWHMGRLLDVFLTQQVKGEAAENERWICRGWAKRTCYDPRGLGRDGWGSVNGYTSEEVAAIPHFTKEQLLGYLDEVYDVVKAYIQNTPMAYLKAAAPGLGGRYTKYQVLSMALMDNVRHLGEIYALKNMWSRAHPTVT